VDIHYIFYVFYALAFFFLSFFLSFFLGQGVVARLSFAEESARTDRQGVADGPTTRFFSEEMAPKKRYRPLKKDRIFLNRLYPKYQYDAIFYARGKGNVCIFDRSSNRARANRRL